VGQLQIKIAQIERRLEESNQEIEDLKYSVSSLKSQVGKSSIRRAPSAPVSRVFEKKSKTIESSEGTSRIKKSSSSSTRIIRVPVSAKLVQSALKNAGYYDGVIDGKIGSGSKQAIKEFQGDHDLKVDGVIGRQTWSELKNYLD